MNLELFNNNPPKGLIHFTNFIDLKFQNQILEEIDKIINISPLKRIKTKKGGNFSTQITNCGKLGWWSDHKGYRYTNHDPITGLEWPKIPNLFIQVINKTLHHLKLEKAFMPDACLINYYSSSSKMGLHQDKDEKDMSQPIITISLGDKADFMIGGIKRSQKPDLLSLRSGDILVMSKDSRPCFHGIKKIHPGTSPIKKLAGRFSLTFRKAG